MGKEPVVYLNGAFVDVDHAFIHALDLSVQRGYGVFDYLRVSDNRPAFLEYHLQRFERSAKEMRLFAALSEIDLPRIITDLIRRNKMPESGIRLTLTGGRSADGYSIGEPSLIIAQSPLQMPSADQFQSGIKLMTHSHQRQLPHVKTIDYLMPVYLQSVLKEKGFDDVLYQLNGSVSECPRANIFIVKGSEVITPGKNILEGITRKRILMLDIPGITIIAKDVHIEELMAADEVFITSTTKAALPVIQIDSKIFNAPGPITTKIFDAIQLSPVNV
jgi:branched-chain amino acid aminotransferase